MYSLCNLVSSIDLTNIRQSPPLSVAEANFFFGDSWKYHLMVGSIILMVGSIIVGWKYHFDGWKYHRAR